MKILIDNGHGVDTLGKRSPDGVLREYAYTRDIARKLKNALEENGYDAVLIVPEEKDVNLRERCKRVNEICRREGASNVLLVSIHCNAAGNGVEWKNANGWSAHISTTATKSSLLARHLIKAAEAEGLKIRRYSSLYPFWVQNLAICRDTLCTAVLTENLFQDNKRDVDYLLSEEGRQSIVNLHYNGIVEYIKGLQL